MAKKRGRGVAACWYGIARTATVDRAGAWAEIDDGGTAKIVTGVTEIGEGILTVLAQIAAQEIGVRPQDVTIGDNDTARSPEAAHAGATRQTYMIGNVVALASRAGARHAGRRDGQALGRRRPHHQDRRRRNLGRGHQPRMPMSEAVHIAKSRGVVPVGSASFGTDTTGLDPVDGSGRPWQAYVFGCQVAEVEVDTLTGEVQVLGIWAVHDVGRAVNPRGVEGQIEGGIVQALGQGLMEDYQHGRRPRDDAQPREIHLADLARRAACDLGDPRGPRSDRAARGQRHRRARHDSDYSGRHERDLRCCRGADHFAAGDAGKSA